MTMYTVQMPSIAGRADASSGPCSAPAHAPHAPRRAPSEPAPHPAPRPRAGRGDAERIEHIERGTAKAFHEMDVAMGPVENMGWQLKLGVHAHERGVLSTEFFPYFQDRINGVQYDGVQSAAERGALNAIKSYAGALGGPNQAVYGAAIASIDALADARCAAEGQVAFLQQGLNALSKRKPPADPCAPRQQPGPRPRPPEHAAEHGRGEFAYAEEHSSRQAHRVVVRGD